MELKRGNNLLCKKIKDKKSNQLKNEWVEHNLTKEDTQMTSVWKDAQYHTSLGNYK